MADPQQELFTKLKLEIKALGYAVYDGELPPDNTPYPFVYLAGFGQSDIRLKNAIMGEVTPIIHVWHNTPKKRGTVSNMLLLIKQVCYRLDKTDNYTWLLNSLNQDILTDTTTTAPLLHGVLNIGFKFS